MANKKIRGGGNAHSKPCGMARKLKSGKRVSSCPRQRRTGFATSGRGMTKKLNRHSVHLSDELETLVKKRMRAGGFSSLNSYFESLVEREGEFLRTCATCADHKVAESVRSMLEGAQESGPVPWRGA